MVITPSALLPSALLPSEMLASAMRRGRDPNRPEFGRCDGIAVGAIGPAGMARRRSRPMAVLWRILLPARAFPTHRTQPRCRRLTRSGRRAANQSVFPPKRARDCKTWPKKRASPWTSWPRNSSRRRWRVDHDAPPGDRRAARSDDVRALLCEILTQLEQQRAELHQLRLAVQQPHTSLSGEDRNMLTTLLPTIAGTLSSELFTSAEILAHASAGLRLVTAGQTAMTLGKRSGRATPLHFEVR